MEQVDVIIIGGGIAASTLAYRLNQFSKIDNILMIRSPDYHNASINNQSWLQSGLLYDPQDIKQLEVARLCINHGKNLLLMGNYDWVEKSGIMTLANEGEALRRLQLLPEFDENNPHENFIPRRKVADYIGKYDRAHTYNRDCVHIWTPDQPFPEGDLLRKFQRTLTRNPRNRIAVGDARLVKKSCANGFIVEVEGTLYEPKYLFVLAGLNTNRLLEPLGLDAYMDIHARRCVLFKADKDEMNLGLGIPLYMDRHNNINVNTIARKGGGYNLLLGDGLSSPVKSMYEPIYHSPATKEEMAAFLQNYKNAGHNEVYNQLKTKMKPEYFNVCYKVESNSYLPWIKDMGELSKGEFSNIHVAGAGKATLAYHVAEQLIFNAKIDSTKKEIEENQFSNDLPLGDINVEHFGEN